jgi:hypothetical protein
MKETSLNHKSGIKPRGWDALEIKLKAKGLSASEIEEARKSFFEGMETLTKMFMLCYDPEKNTEKKTLV